MARRGAQLLIGLLLVFAVVLPFYSATLQTIPNGADHYYMIDVGETQVVLNVWGTLHATGYPLYVMTGSLLTAFFRALGADAAAAPGLVSLLWGLAALALIYALGVHLTRRPLAAASATALYGLTRSVWVHNSVAEIYTFGLFLAALLLLIALWRGPLRGRVYWLAFVGGIAIGHHRAAATLILALVYAAWPALLRTMRRRGRLRTLALCLLIGLAGLLPYAYLPLRAGAPWVYGEPGTLGGLWDQFIGAEAARFIGAPPSLAANFAMLANVLLTDLTLPGLLTGLSGLLLALRDRRLRRPALTLLLVGLGAYLFHLFLYSDTLSALILHITLSAAFGWLFLADLALRRAAGRWRLPAAAALTGAALLLGTALVSANLPFIRALTTDPTGLETIALVKRTPPGSALMIAWGTRHFAAGFARDVQRALPGVVLVDHKADFRARAARGPLVTPDFTFYAFPVDWWAERLGGPVYLRAAAPGLVQIALEPRTTAQPLRAPASVVARRLTCAPDGVTLALDWAAPQPPAEDLSVFVHLLDDDGALLAQADQSAPVYGWRPLTTWGAGEVVRDIYLLPPAVRAGTVRYGLYRTLPDGQFENVFEDGLPLRCED